MSTLDDIIDLHSNKPQSLRVNGVCPGCKETCELVLTASQTRYVWDGNGVDPNASFYACEYCSKEYTEYIEDRWRDYYADIMS